jgi:hypothetical protein
MERDSGGDHHSCRHRTGDMTFQPGDFFFDAGAEPIGPYLVRILVLACGPGRIYGCAVFSDPGNPSRITSRRTYTHTELAALDLVGGPTRPRSLIWHRGASTQRANRR